MCMTYTSEDIENLLTEMGELMIILESDREYDLHVHDTEFNHDSGEIETEGMLNGEYVFAQFPAERVEHVRWHKES
ncbi:hypothetical protein M199_gp046 [Halogranum tailed virus 1]|uniref:Uncharacterized protein n=1 Tax=Halogranum tailed virus 1 TaxID=1273749 RepID=R4TGK3_9CAUD|nr:hypothetical protein M199_gp046 [Halogranum tailed virus 1]AGM11376.1 hypothetical protein HGTV1_46 [Halogranum tailed virus 1]